MKNQGLKKYTKQLTQEIGNVAVGYVNLNKEAANLILGIPLVESMGPNEFELSLFYNYQNRNQMGDFGKGMVPNYQKKIVPVNGGIGVENADGSIDTYTYQLGYYRYENEETKQRLYEDEVEDEATTYRLEDKFGNSANYIPSEGLIEVFYANKEKFKYTSSGIDNYRGAIIQYERSGNLITKITYVQNQVEQIYLLLEYDTFSRLVKIKTYRNESLIKELEIVYKDQQMMVLDCISKNCVLYHFSNECVNCLEYGYNQNFTDGRTITINYQEVKTIVTNEQNLKHTYYFNKELLPIYEMDSLGTILAYEYDERTKELVSESSLLSSKETDINSILNGYIDKFRQIEGVSIQEENCQEEEYGWLTHYIYRVSGTGQISYSTTEKILNGESITLFFIGKQNKEYSAQTNVEVVLTIGNQTVRKNCFKKKTLDGLFEIVSIGLTCKESSDKLTATFHFYGDASIDFGRVQILRKDFGAVYEYDDQGNLIKSTFASGTRDTAYNQENRPARLIGVDSTSYEYEYDSKGNLTKAKTGFSTSIRNFYDKYNHLIRQEASNHDQSKIIETCQDYSADGKHITSQFDELGNETKYSYDSFGRLIKVVNALNHVMDYSYNEFDGLTKIIFNQQEKESYTYDSLQRITAVQLSNGSQYKFNYTNEYLTSIALNGTVIVTYGYDKKTGLIITQDYSLTSRYKFTYNERNLIRSVQYWGGGDIKDYLAGNAQYYYDYNNLDQLITIKNDKGEVLIRYEYDSDGNVISTSGDGFRIKNQFNEYGLISNKAIQVEDHFKNVSYQRVEQAMGCCPEAIEGIYLDTNDYFGTIFNSNAEIKNKQYSIKPLKSDGFNYSTIHHVPCLLLRKDTSLSYVIPLKNAYPLDSNSVGFWFYLKEQKDDIRCLFDLKNARNNCRIRVYIDMENKLVLDIIEQNSEAKTIISNQSCHLNEWNFFGLSWMNRQDEGGINVSEYALFLNEDYQLEKKENPRYNTWFNETDSYHIGHCYDESMEGLNSPITALMVGAKKHRTIAEMQDYYEQTKEYLYASLPTSGTILYTTKMNSEFDIYPLHNSVESFKGKKPVAYNLRSVSTKDKNRNFVYDNELKRFTYKADKNAKLECIVSTTGTIMMRAKINEAREKNYILECRNSDEKLGLYCSNQYLEVVYKEKHYNTGLKVSLNQWHTIGLSFMDHANYYPNIEQCKKMIRVYLDGKVYLIQETTKGFSTGGNYTVSIGKKSELTRKGTNLGDISTYYPLEGQIEMLAIRNAFCEVETLDLLNEELKSYTKTNEYDELGLLEKTSLKYGNETILTNTFSYEYRSKEDEENYTSSRVRREQIQFGNMEADRFYATNELGNVTTVLDNIFGKHSYIYSERGFLIQEDSTSYEYDGNGNIIKAGNNTFEYDSVIKDKLIGVNGTEITYSGLNPVQYGLNSYTYEGRRLTQVSIGIGARKKNIYYTYNDQGLRTSKKVNSVETKYYYDGDKLIAEINPTYRLDYLYDENGLLYGFIKDNQEKYFYVRDFMQNILGIVDKDGQLIVKYKYNAWGDHSVTDGNDKVNTSDTFIGNINAMRYKGYYYDKETKMYYCKSRYYVVEWCRWLNADNVGYLDLENINGMNLFSYCGNNPITGCDPTGHFAITFGIAALIAITFGSALIGGAAQLTSNVLAGATGSELWRGVAGAALGTGVNALALCLAMPTGGASIFIAAGASALVQTGVDTIETLIRGEEIGWSTLLDLGLNFGTTLFGNYIGGKLMPINSGWFKPQKFLSVFLKPYGQKILLQSSIGAAISGVVNLIKKFDWGGFKPNPSMPGLRYLQIH